MRGIAAKPCWGRAIGVYLRDGRITVTEVAGALGGVRTLAEHDAEVGPDGPGAALRKLLAEHFTARQRRRIPLCVGIGAEHTFFATRPFKARHDETPSLEMLLTDSGAAGVWDADQVVADYVVVKRFKPIGGRLYSVAAVRKDLVRELYAALTGAGVRNFRLEPCPWSILSAADRKSRPPRRWKIAVRILLHAGGGLAILAAEGRPLMWRRFALPPAGDGEDGSKALSVRVQSVVSVVQTVMAHAAASLGIRTIGGIILQGTGARALLSGIANDLGMEVAASDGDGEGLTDGLCGFAMALAAKRNRELCFDLFGPIRPAPAIREMFPWKLAGLVVLLAAAMGLMMWSRSSRLARRYEIMAHRNAAHPWAGPYLTAALGKERRGLLTEVTAVRRFLDTRIVWSDYLRDLPTRLPPNACLSDLAGVCDLRDTGRKKHRKKENKSLTLRGMTRFADRGAAPKEIDAFLRELRNVPYLKRDFPVVQLAEIKWRREGGSDIATFIIVAMPEKGKK